MEREQLEALDVIRDNSGTHHLLIDGVSYHCRVASLDPSTKTATIVVNGKSHRLQIQDEVDQMVRALGLTKAVSAAGNDVFAPMPGLVLDVLVQPGDEIEAGTPLLILEAMKMENVLKAEGAGTVKSIEVEKGNAVEKRQLLIEIE